MAGRAVLSAINLDDYNFLRGEGTFKSSRMAKSFTNNV
jgi:hypothetical protein